MKINSKQKGSAFERKMAKLLSLWITDFERSDSLWRSAMSGGRSTVAWKKDENVANEAGDISARDAFGFLFLSKFVVECKHLKDLEVMQLLYGRGTGHFAGIWDKLVTECLYTKQGREPFLIAKQNRQPELLFTSKKGCQILGIGGPSFPPTAVFSAKPIYCFVFGDIINKIKFSDIKHKFEDVINE